MNGFLVRAKELEQDILKDRRHIHRNPEVGAVLPETCSYIVKRLKEMGIEPEICADYGVVARLGKKGKTFMLRADMDALPMGEDSGLSFASPYSDRAHTCGHDTHMAMLLGAARILKENEDHLKGTVKLVFQPDEEGLGGALSMIEAGVLEDVDTAMAVHIDATMPLGYLTRGVGNAFASNDFFDVKVTGKGGHAARPADAIDVITVMAHIQLAIQTLISREAAPTEVNVISITSVEAGKGAYNILPDEGIMHGTLRTYNADQRELLKRRLREVTAMVGETFRAQAAVEYHGDGIPPVFCDPGLSDDLAKYGDELFGKDYVAKEGFIKVGSEDFAFYCRKIPAGYFFLGAGPDEHTVWPYGQHNPKVMHNESVLYKGSALEAYCAVRWLEEHGE